MKKGNTKEHLAAWAAKVWLGLKSHPVELIVLLHATLAVIVDGHSGWQKPAYYAAFATVAALCLSFYRARRWPRWAYWAVLPLYALCALLPEQWHHTPEYVILTALLIPAYLLACGRDFSKRFFSMVRSMAVALGVGMLIFLVLTLITESVNSLFDLEHWDGYEYSLPVCFILLVPMVFIGMESGGDEPKATKLEEALVNWILTPALLIYNAVLYVYLATILVQWELPKGSVATMSAAFMVALMGVRWLRPTLTRQPLEWYFRWSGLLALPLVGLFWVATGYRIGQYGLTIDRCTLIASGIGMTVYAVMSPLRPRRGGYGFMALTLAVGLLLAIAARPLSMHSQTTVVRENAKAAGVLASDGTLQFSPKSVSDTAYRTEHRLAYQAMKYIENDLHDTIAVRQRFGMDSKGYLEHLSRQTARYAKAYSVDARGDDPVDPALEMGFYVSLNEPGEMLLPGEYSRLYPQIHFDKGIITIGDTTLAADSVLAVQLAKVGYSLRSNLDQDKLNAHANDLCVYHSPDGRMVIVFDYIHISGQTDGNHLVSGEISCALIK